MWSTIGVLETDVMGKPDEEEEIDYDCGCQISKSEDGTWIVTYFCEEHDPTVEQE